MNNFVKERTTCRLCDGSLSVVLDLGNICASDFVSTNADPLAAPLTLVKCDNCDLVQLKHTVDQDILYRQYWYKSALNASMIAALQDVVTGIEKRINFNDSDIVYDIGCNDGTLLKLYKKPLFKIGFDPAKNLAGEAEKACSEFYNTYFTYKALKVPFSARAVTTIAMFYDLEEPHSFIEDIKKILQSDGVWVIQFTDLFSMFRINAFDNICHEHLEYYSFKVLSKLLADHGLEVFDVETNDVNGGSVRCYVGHPGAFKVQDAVKAHAAAEDAYFAQFKDPFFSFAERVEKIKAETVNFFYRAKHDGKILALMGASTKGNTTLQYFGLNDDIFSCAAEVNPDKFGLKTVATNVPIMSEADAFAKKPDYMFVLPWHFINGIRNKSKDYFARGGKLVVPMPEFKIYNE